MHTRVLDPELPRLPSELLRPAPHVGASQRGAPLSIAPPGAVAVPLPGARRIAQKTLLLGATGDEPAFLAAKDALVRVGVPFRAVAAATESLTAAMLQTDSTCNFNSIIFATSGLGYLAPDGTWGSALTAEEWQLVTDFEVACSAREVIWFAWPSVDLGLQPPSMTFQWTDAIEAHVADPSFFVSVPAGATIPIRNAAGYGTAPADAATTPILVAASGHVLLAHHTHPDGREVLISTVDQSPYALHTLALEYDVLRWLTRGIYVGQKRAYLAPQVDDLFLDNDTWVVGVGVDEEATARVTGADLDAYVAWQAGYRAALPAGSSFVSIFAFNGVGTLASEYADQTLLVSALQAGAALQWVSHTWDHETMDALTQGEASNEIERNHTVANQYGLNGYSRRDLVTPDVSGLQNGIGLFGMFASGVRNVVSDTSITEAMRPENPGTNPSFNVGRVNPYETAIYQVPRHPTNLFYNVSTPAAWSDEYNAIYRWYYGRDLSYEEIVAADAQFGTFYLLRGDIDPLMFHQLNIANYGGGRSLLGDWLDAATAKYLALSSGPIRTLTLRATATAMKARRAFDICGITATIVEAGTARSLELSTTGACTVPVTGLAAPATGSVESYLGAPTTSIVMTANATRSVALP